MSVKINKNYIRTKKKKVEENVLGKTQKYLKFRAKKKVKKSERQKTKFEKNSSHFVFKVILLIWEVFLF